MPSAKDIKELRARTGAGILDCKKALTECDENLDKAVDWLRAKGLAAAAKRAGRIASEGVVGSYIHAGGKIGVLVEVNCETDFVARTDQFKALVKEIGMQIAAHTPEYVAVDDLPSSVVDRERAVQRARVLEEGKPEAVADRIVEGRLKKYFQEVCLLEQPYFREDKKTVKDLLAESIAAMGENIKIRRFTCFVLGEGLEKRQDDFAAEVAAQTARQ